MKIRNQSDIEKLNSKIQDELGIDMTKYRNQEVAESFVDLMVFPKYALNWTLRPVFLFFILFIAGFFFVDLVNVQYILYTFPGIALFLLNGLFLGLLYLTWKIKDDIKGILEYSLDILKSCVTDLNKVGVNLTGQNKKEVLGLLFTGVIHIVTIPVLSGVISKKIPVVGGLAQRIVKRTLSVFADRVNFDNDNQKEIGKDFSESRILEVYTNSISSVNNGLNKVLGLTVGIVQFPLKIIFAISFLTWAFFLYLIW